jgi:hypothetical protein
LNPYLRSVLDRLRNSTRSVLNGVWHSRISHVALSNHGAHNRANVGCSIRANHTAGVGHHAAGVRIAHSAVRIAYSAIVAAWDTRVHQLGISQGSGDEEGEGDLKTFGKSKTCNLNPQNTLIPYIFIAEF